MHLESFSYLEKPHEHDKKNKNKFGDPAQNISIS